MTLAYSYIRFSTPDQRLGDSLRRQIAQARAWADANRLELDDTFRDEGRSAFRGRHRDEGAALAAVLAAIENGRIAPGSYLLIESLDRLSREEVTKALRLFLGILEKGVVIVTLADGQTYSDETVSAGPTQLIVSIAVMMRAHDESRIKSQRVGAAWRNKRELARSQNKAMTRICPAWLRKEGDRYVVLPDRVEVVRRMFGLSIGGCGTRAIAKTLNRDGTPVFGRGRIWHDSYVKKILDNEAVLGRFVPASTSKVVQAEDPVDGYFPAIVDERTFMRSRAALRGRASSSVRVPIGRVRNLLSGLARCSECCGGMHYVDKGTRHGLPYLQCGSSRLSGGCTNNVRFPYRTAELVLVVFARQASMLATEASGSQDLSALEMERGEVNVRLDRLVAMVEGGEDSGRRVLERIRALEASLVDIDRVINDVRKAALVAAAEPTADALDTFLDAYNRLQSESSDGDLRRLAAVAVRRTLRSFEFSANGTAQVEFLNGNIYSWQRMNVMARPVASGDTPQIPSPRGCSGLESWRDSSVIE